MISLYIIPNDNENDARVERCIESFEGLADDVVVMENRRLHNITDVKKPWWCFMFDNEYIDSNLRISIPSYLLEKDERHHYFVLYKKDKFGRVYYAPRLFRRGVRIQDGPSLIPDKPHLLTAGYIFDGWLLG